MIIFFAFLARQLRSVHVTCKCAEKVFRQHFPLRVKKVSRLSERFREALGDLVFRLLPPRLGGWFPAKVGVLHGFGRNYAARLFLSIFQQTETVKTIMLPISLTCLLDFT